MEVSQNEGVLFWGVPIKRITIFWDLYWGPPILGNYNILNPKKYSGTYLIDR